MLLKTSIIALLIFTYQTAWSCSDTTLHAYKLKRISEKDVMAASVINDSIIVVGTAMGEVILKQIESGFEKLIWSGNEAVSNLFSNDSLICIISEETTKIISTTGKLLHQISGENLMNTSVIFAKYSIFFYGAKDVFEFSLKKGVGFHHNFNRKLNTIAYKENTYYLGFDNGYVELRKTISTKAVKSFQASDSAILFLEPWKDKLISISKNKIRIWDAELLLVRERSFQIDYGISVINENIFWTSNDSIYSYNIVSDSLEIYSSYINRPQKTKVLDRGVGKVAFYNIFSQNQKTIPFSNSITNLSLANDGSSLLVGGKTELFFVDSFSKIKKHSIEYFNEIISVSLDKENSQYFVGSANGFCGVFSLKDNKVKIQMCSGFIAFNGGSFSDDGKYILITGSSNKTSYIHTAEIINAYSKKSKSIRHREKIWQSSVYDTLPILSSTLIPSTSTLIISRGKELLFYDYVRNSLIKKLSLDKDVCSIYVSDANKELIIGNVEGFVSIYSLIENQWISNYHNFDSQPIVAISSTIKGDTLFVATSQKILILDRAGRILDSLTDTNITDMKYSVSKKTIIYSTGSIDVKKHYMWVEPNLKNIDADFEVDSPILKLLISKNLIYVLTTTEELCKLIIK